MDNNKRQKLEQAGWQVGTVSEFLELSPSESQMIELKLALSQQFKSLRERQKLSLQALAEKMQSSPSNVAKIEEGDSSVTIDLMIQGLFSMGATCQEIAKIMLDS
ncbi:helix-turn-helix domain-containing protein [Cyanothece sp. BG0011]|uniref:helix-turn-helix domain-containing protein n=1 Tax=Cyanothece sp. BG0011 TaxID=2082950 RepID=UPI000D1DB90B|nr:helix-turn-helix transcriptional regulator [Cyanothece sp. BG0011]